MPKVCDAVAAMEELAPVGLAEEWDNVGLLAGDSEREVSRIIVMLDLDEQGLSEALEVGADMIVTHHPFIMTPLKSVTDKTILKLIENKISVCSMHTNLDTSPEGVNTVLANTVGISDAEDVVLDGFLTKGGNVDECSFGEFIQSVKLSLNADAVRYIGNKSAKIRRVCVLGGSGADFIPQVKNLGFDAFVTSDVKYHQAQTAEKIGLCVIDAGHFETENPVIYKVARHLAERLEGVDVITSLRKKSYIKYE